MNRLTCLIVCAIFAIHACAAPATQPVWEADSFAIGYWCGPTAKFTTLERYQEIKDAGFTIAFPPCCATTPEMNRKILDYCQQVGLKAFVSDSRLPVSLGTDPKVKAGLDGVIADYSKHPAFTGYFIADEPGVGAYPALGEVVDYLRRGDPKHFAFINLLPNHAPEWAIGKNYEQYVRGFADIVKPPIISYDNYGFAAGATQALFDNLAIVRKVSLETSIPFWNIILSTQHGPYRNLTEGDLRFQAMNTVAYGAKGLLWFTYWSPADSDKSFDWKHALIDVDGKRDPHYDMVKRVNGEVQALGTEVLKAKSIAIFGTQERAKSPLKFEGEALVSVFEADNNTITMVVNGSWEKPLKTDVELRDGAKKAELYDRPAKKWTPLNGGKVAVDLPPGDGVLIRWEK